jgi:hypothetical protein
MQQNQIRLNLEALPQSRFSVSGREYLVVVVL